MDRIVLFDGVCNFCNSAVNFIIGIDRERKIKFAPLQSETGIRLRKQHNIPDDVDSLILIEGNKAYIHSTAGLRIYRAIGGIWSILYGLILVPAPIRDYLYKLFARYRYKLFGKQEACMLPTPDVRERFL
jgi:predicted DCC family thiol-disulfide oxidoreductase YuxK